MFQYDRSCSWKPETGIMKQTSGFLWLLFWSTSLANEYNQNLAVQGTATQSSQHAGGAARKAIDGDRNSNWPHASHTENDYEPWWRLDLGKTHKVFTVSVTNRGDAVPERINGAEIRIGDSLENNGNNNPTCAVISSIPGGTTSSFQCEGMDGRYVNIVIPRRSEYLTLCEVEVYGYQAPNYPNLAVQGTATQSSQHAGGAAGKAIDGDRNSNWPHASHTENDYEPWWRLDLGKTHKVFTVSVINRGDAVPERINGAEIRIGDSLENNGNNNPRCAVISSIPGGTTSSFQCEGMDGRYVNIVIPKRREYLTLCEVEVYGYPSPTEENLAVQGTATQSSQYAGGAAGKAIDGDRNSNWPHASHTENDYEPWWRLDLGKTHKVFTVSVTNRGDAVPERINGAEIRIGDSLENNGNNNPTCAVISSIPGGTTSIFQCGGMDGRYINIVIPGRSEYLTLCEVEVYGSRLD